MCVCSRNNHYSFHPSIHSPLSASFLDSFQQFPLYLQKLSHPLLSSLLTFCQILPSSLITHPLSPHVSVAFSGSLASPEKHDDSTTSSSAESFEFQSCLLSVRNIRKVQIASHNYLCWVVVHSFFCWAIWGRLHGDSVISTRAKSSLPPAKTTALPGRRRPLPLDFLLRKKKIQLTRSLVLIDLFTFSIIIVHFISCNFGFFQVRSFDHSLVPHPFDAYLLTYQPTVSLPTFLSTFTRSHNVPTALVTSWTTMHSFTNVHLQ